MDEGTSIGVVMLYAVYFCPTIIAALRRRTNTTSIFLLNLFLGWTMVAWVVALCWATTFDPRKSGA